jgi:hypothetical protein
LEPTWNEDCDPVSEAFRSALIAQFKKLQRRSPVPAQDWPTVAPLVVTRFGRGKALAAIQRLKEIDVDDHHRASVDVALEALGLGRYRGSVETRLAYAGAALDPPVGYWRARDYAEQGYAILADLALSDRYSDEPGFTIAVSPARAKASSPSPSTSRWERRGRTCTST